MHIYIYMHVLTHTHIHVYTHTHTKCTYERTQSTSETTARQRLRGTPNFTPTSSLPCPLQSGGGYPWWPAAQSPVHEERLISATNSSSSHHHDSALSRPHSLICTGEEPIHPVHCPRKLPAWLWTPETRSFFCHFGWFFFGFKPKLHSWKGQCQEWPRALARPADACAEPYCCATWHC